MADHSEKHLNQKAKAHQKYTLGNGAVVPGVTTILSVIAKPELIFWANRKGLEGIDTRKFVDEAAVIGTLVHQMVEEDLGGEAWDRDEYSQAQIKIAERSFAKYLEWKKGRDIATRLIEAKLVSEKFRFGGTCDWYGMFDGQYWLLDIKTSKAVYPEFIYQVAAYKKLLLEAGFKVTRTGILRLGRNEDEGFEFRTLGKAELTDGWKTFKAAHRLYLEKKNFEGRYGK